MKKKLPEKVINGKEEEDSLSKDKLIIATTEKQKKNQPKFNK